MLHPTRTAPTRPGRKGPEIDPTPGVAETNPGDLTFDVAVTRPDGLTFDVAVTRPDGLTLDVAVTSPDGPTLDVAEISPDGPTLPLDSTRCRLKTATVTADLADPAGGARVAIR